MPQSYRTFLAWIAENCTEAQALVDGSTEYPPGEGGTQRLRVILDNILVEIRTKEERYDNSRKARAARGWEATKA